MNESNAVREIIELEKPMVEIVFNDDKNVTVSIDKEQLDLFLYDLNHNGYKLESQYGFKYYLPNMIKTINATLKKSKIKWINKN